MDVDDRWWVDLIIQDQPPEVSYVSIGSQIACDGFNLKDGRVLVRRASVQPTDLSDWPTDTPIALHVVA